MSKASNILFWIGTVATIATFGICVAWNFVNVDVQQVLNWIALGTSLVAAGCYMAYEIITKKLIKHDTSCENEKSE